LEVGEERGRAVWRLERKEAGGFGGWRGKRQGGLEVGEERGREVWRLERKEAGGFGGWRGKRQGGLEVGEERGREVWRLERKEAGRFGGWRGKRQGGLGRNLACKRQRPVRALCNPLAVFCSATHEGALWCGRWPLACDVAQRREERMPIHGVEGGECEGHWRRVDERRCAAAALKREATALAAGGGAGTGCAFKLSFGFVYEVEASDMGAKPGQ
jgi:hypothetical protein